MAGEMKTMNDLLVHELKDLYDAEQRLTKALPKMAKATTSKELKGVFESHLTETKAHVDRLRKSLETLDEKVEGETCEAMKGLLAEGEEVMKLNAEDAVRDAALIGAAQRVEHYEIAGYGTAHSFAIQAGHQNVADLLKSSLDEEKNADKMLTALAKQSINAKVST